MASPAFKDMNFYLLRSLSGFGMEPVYAARIFLSFLEQKPDPLILREIDQEIAHLHQAYNTGNAPWFDCFDSKHDLNQIVSEYVRRRGIEFRSPECLDSPPQPLDPNAWKAQDWCRGEQFLLIENHNLLQELTQVRKDHLQRLETDLDTLKRDAHNDQILRAGQIDALGRKIEELLGTTSRLEADKLIYEESTVALKAEMVMQNETIAALQESSRERDLQLTSSEALIEALQNDLLISRQNNCDAEEVLERERTNVACMQARLSGQEEQYQKLCLTIAEVESQNTRLKAEIELFRKGLLMAWMDF